jgi:hypothetical protein
VRSLARYERLPIYKTPMDLAVYLEQVVRTFSRYHKLHAGERLAAAEPRAGDGDYPGQLAAEKLPVLREWLEALPVLLRIGQEVRAFQSLAAYGRGYCPRCTH